ncbi:MAG: rhodanese-related sulfurtransferase [Candidatus Babeliaceae bacterium]|jgi:predicted sulfurtransferase
MGKVLLFYKYVTISDPEKIKNWLLHLCRSLNITGRIIIAHEGINATVAGSIEATETFRQEFEQHELFDNIDFKESAGDADCFPKLRVVVKEEIVKLGVSPTLITAENGGQHLTPQETHELLNNKPDDLVILDTRNIYESNIGRFEEAILAPIDNFRDLPQYLDDNQDLFKDKDVLMYCTGGIRCERATAYLKSKNIARNVYQIAGGIHRYAEAFPDGHFRGKNYVFDARIALPVTSDILSSCAFCTKPCDDYTNCINAQCNKQIIVCPSCIDHYHNTCSAYCQNLVDNNMVNVRILPKKVLVSQHCSL